ILFYPSVLFNKNSPKILQTEKELILAKSLNEKIKMLNIKINTELNTIKIKNNNKNLFLSKQEKRISLIPFKDNEKDLKIAQLELERIAELRPIQYREC
ncbi:hypothetical protein ACU6T3_11065, partial [Avibacterium paragallinarum]